MNTEEKLAVDEVEEISTDETQTKPEEITIEIEGITSIDGDPFKGQAAPSWVKQTREENRELRRKLKELEASGVKPVAEQLGAKPTLESCNYDETKFEAELTTWHSKKRQADDEAKQREAEAERQNKSWNESLASYEAKKQALNLPDFKEAEEEVVSTLSKMQQSIIVKRAKDSALLVFAIGKNPEIAGKLAAITDPIEFAFEVARLEGSLKVTSKKAVPAPDRPVRGSSAATALGGPDAILTKLRAEAEKTGNYTKVTAYKRQLRQKTG